MCETKEKFGLAHCSDSPVITKLKVFVNSQKISYLFIFYIIKISKDEILHDNEKHSFFSVI